MNADDVAACFIGDLVRFPSAEELRMVRAIALLALREAACHGQYRASFHGFCVQATRRCWLPDPDERFDVDLCVSLGRAVVARSRVAASDAIAMEPLP